jgi:signal transduction histidine kinase/CheY-like chemotaxis protein
VLAEVAEESGPIEYRSNNTGAALEARARKVSSTDERNSWLVLLRDITASLEARKREEELSAQLQHSQKLEAIGQLAGGVAHDFNNLLTVVSGYSDFIEDLKEEGASEIADELRTACQRGVVLTRQLLSFARREVVSPIPLDLSETVRGLRNFLGRLLGEQIRIQISAEQVCTIKADPGQIEQVILNLAANARDAMPQGGTLRLRVFRRGQTVALEVQDTGVGIDDEMQLKIFDPFFTTKPRGKGTGLGLATVHGIVTQAHGRIVVESRPGHGATFQIIWPMTNEALPGQPPESHISRPHQGEGLILLAEDDKRARKLIVRMLQEAGFEVLVAQDGAEALSLAVNLDRSPDLLLTDVVMPGMSGVELIERVQKMHPNVGFLLMSGYTDQQLAPARFDLARDLLQKPFGRRELLDRVAMKLSAVRSRLADGT